MLWIIPLAAFYFLTSGFQLWKNLSVFFTKAAFVTFGGAYAVLPYVAQGSVEQFNWLTNLQMIDGLALGETTPGQANRKINKPTLLIFKSWPPNCSKSLFSILILYILPNQFPQ
ncbi:chromate transporter [Algoriphagus sp. D3-2-R+10]|uniref:chromate transporter n=1 Tax=Algoriphagus aurantiacus TaxID=3103948 RepID=UPI003A5CEA7E